MRLETKLNKTLPDWPSFKVQFHELIRESEGGWSVNDSWTARCSANKEETISLLRSRWEIFKLNYLSKARVSNIEDIGCDDDICLEVNYSAFVTLTKGE